MSQESKTLKYVQTMIVDRNKIESYLDKLGQECYFQVNFPTNGIETPDGYLITFGCSWTYGVGSFYESEMTEKEYKQIAWDTELTYQHSWRKIVADKLNLININFSIGASTNELQFMMAEIFFSSDLWKFIEESSKKVIVLWGTTSLLRKTVWSVKDKQNITVWLDVDSDMDRDKTQRIINIFSNIYTKLFFDSDNEINNLCHRMNCWNTFFEKVNVRNFWFDTFISFNYPKQIKNLIGVEETDRDLLFYLCKINGNIINEKKIHRSTWSIDNKKIEFLYKNQLVNPYSFHPTRECHKQLGEFFIQKLL